MISRTIAPNLVSRLRLFIARLVFLVVVGAVWELMRAVDPALSTELPALPKLFSALGSLLRQGSLWSAIGRTAEATVLGLALCIVVGVLVGILLAIRVSFFQSSRFVVDFLRTIPPLALIPLGLLVYGPTLRMEVLLTLAGAVWPILLQTYFGVRGVDPYLLDTARSYLIPLWRRSVFVLAPACSPSIATGIRTSATLCLLLTLSCELLGGVAGLGQVIATYQQNGQTAYTYASIAIAGALGVLLNAGLKRLEQRGLEWHHAPRTSATR